MIRTARTPYIALGLLTAVMVPIVSSATASSNGGLTPASITVSGDQWGTSTCHLGVTGGATEAEYSIADLQDLGINAFRAWTSMNRLEWQDDDGIYGSPSIAEIKADPDEVNWTWWDNAFATVPSGMPYDFATLFADLKVADIEPVIVLRNAGPGGVPTWAPNPPTTEDDWNEWWEHVFANAYWLNVRNDFQVDRYQALNEPNFGLASQGWGGTKEQYFELVEVTNDALDHVYSTYLPGRDYELHAPVTAGAPSSWVQGALQQIPNAFTTVDVHNYGVPSIEPQTQIVRGWMSSTGNEDKKLWLSEWGSLDSNYDEPSIAIGHIIANMIRGSKPGNSRIDGSNLFRLYDGSTVETGLIDVNGTPHLSYYGFRMAARALNGCRPTFEATTSTSDLIAIATQDEEGSTYLLVAKLSDGSTYEVDVDLSALISNATGTMWRVDANRQDEITVNPSPTNGHFTFNFTGPSSGYAAALIKFDADAKIATADAHVRDCSGAGTNFGTEDFLKVKTWNTPNCPQWSLWSYLKFDLSSVDPGAVDHVNLRLFGGMTANVSAPPMDTSVYAVADTGWSETGITWNNKPTLGSELDTLTITDSCTSDDPVVTDPSPCWFHLDVTNYVQSELAADRTTISLALRNPQFDPTNDKVLRLHSREHSANQPHLQVFGG